MGNYKPCLLWTYALTLSLSSFQFGYSLSVLNPVSQVLHASYVRHHSSIWTVSNYDLLDVIVSTCAPFGAMFGAMTSNFFTSRGRRTALLIANIFPIVGTVMTLFLEVPLLIVGRLLIGYGVGIYSSLIPLMLNQISPLAIRGKITTLVQVQVSTGLLVATLFGLGLPSPSDQQNSSPEPQFWKINLGFPLVLQVIQIVLVLGMFRKDTPAFYFQKGKYEEAKEAIRLIYTEEGSSEAFSQLLAQFSNKQLSNTEGVNNIIEQNAHLLDSQVSNQKGSLVYNKSEEKENQQTSDLDQEPLCGPLLQRTVVTCYLLAVFQQFTGISAIFLYSTDLFAGPKASFHHGIQITALIFGVNALASYFFLVFVDHVGRKPLIVWMYLCKAVCLALLSIFGWINIPFAQEVVVVVYMVFYQFGIGPLLWTYLPECLPPRAVSLGASINWLGFIVISLITKPLTKTSLGVNGTFMIFGGCCLLISLFGAVFLKETKGKSRAEVIAAFSGKCQAQQSLVD